MDWHPHAAQLAIQVTHPVSRWRDPVAQVPRHVFVPRWWRSLPPEGWTLRDGRRDEQLWMRAAYSDRSLVTAVGPLHADHAQSDVHPTGLPTSSSTMPSLVVRMLRHTQIADGMDVLGVGTGSGYSTALLATRLGEDHVTTVDVDPYLTKVGAARLADIGLHPRIVTADAAAGPLPDSYDRIVSMVGVRPIPPAWLAALRPGGRLVTTLGNLPLLVTADRTPDGGAAGRIEWDRAAFMRTRGGPDYPPGLVGLLDAARDSPGEEIGRGRYPVVEVREAWELWAMLEITVPGIEHYWDERGDQQRTAWMLHPDGSWARATGHRGEAPLVHQSGPRRLWDILDGLRHDWLSDGHWPLYGAKVTITPSGVCHLRRGSWQATIV